MTPHLCPNLAALFLIATASLISPAPAQETPPPSPVEEYGFSRGRICLNGVWQFQPALGNPPTAPGNSDWGRIRVPGTWNKLVTGYSDKKNPFPGIVSAGNGAPWKDLNYEILSKAWYERTITIPKEWENRQVLVDFFRISTDAVIYVDGKECGQVTWPGGSVDLTSQVKGGTTHTLRVLVTAAQDKAQTVNAMGVGQNTLVDAKLFTRGIIGETFLVSRPPGARVDSVWIITSTRKKEITVQADLVGISKAGTVKFAAAIKDQEGKVVKEFTQDVPVQAGDSTLSLSSPWADPKLWEVGKPYLYTLELSATGDDLKGGYTQSFGFREVWIEGKNIYLNGTLFRMRPVDFGAENLYSPNNGSITVIESVMDDVLKAGFNIAELWPSDFNDRGTFHFRELTAEIADRKGLPLMGPTLHAQPMLRSWDEMAWKDPKTREPWLNQLKTEWRRYRNSPSILLYTSSGNISGHVDDQDPRRLGRGYDQPIWKKDIESKGWGTYVNTLDDLIATVKKIDPTRPYMIHQGAGSGDIYSTNNYLDLIPLQEREEWLSDWQQNGTKPYCAIEFGTPLSTTMNRGRDGFVFSSTTEWLMTEFCASYLGRNAYQLENAEYRNAISGPNYIKNQVWGWPNQDLMDFAPALQELENLFITNTWRSWRTMGITGGMVPWGHGHGFKPLAQTQALPAFKPGQRGTDYENMPASVVTPYGPPGSEITPAGKALIANNSDTLAWIAGSNIAGDVAAFTAKDHSFTPGETLAKQVVLINDSRSEQAWSFKLKASLEGKSLGVTEKSGKIKVGETLLIPVDFVLPASLGEKQSGELSLEATVGGKQHSDTFKFRVFASAKPLAGSVKVFDPSGETTAMLKKLGLQILPWDGSNGGLLVVGRRAFSSGTKSPGNLEAYVKEGGQVLIMEQDPAWIKNSLGLRICELLTRRVFTMNPSHPVVAGLDSEDLRDWKGFSTLVDPKPDYTQPNIPRNSTPTWGWRWGSRGTVTTTAIEKPHRAGWRPLLECQFDLAYSPLMEMNLGKGRVVLSTLDLEDHIALDPAAALLARNMIQWMQTTPPDIAPAPALYVGGDEGALLLDLVGADYVRAEKVNPSAPLVILGPDVSADLAEPVLAAGGKVLVLPRRQIGPAGLGISVAKNDRFGGSLKVPDWNEVRGVSPGDLRWRADGPALLLSGSDTGADGLMARVVRGKGVAIFTQSDPLTLPADQKQYFRYTRWRMTRTLAQLVSNLGGSFALDNRIFNPGSKQINLAGNWKADWTKKMPVATAPFPDPGITDAAKALVKMDADESKLKEVVMPGYWSEMASADGEAVFRRHFTLPKELAGKDLILNLGAVDDFDETFINGTRVGGIGGETKNYWRVQRSYKVPASLLKEGDNVVAVRIFDNFTTSGIVGPANRMHIGPDEPEAQSFYHPDYRSDFPLGDDPYRYYRW